MMLQRADAAAAWLGLPTGERREGSSEVAFRLGIFSLDPPPLCSTADRETKHAGPRAESQGLKVSR